MFSLVVAMDRQKGIGLSSSLPWHISAELRHFRALTLNKTLIMGSNTFKSLPNKLNNRTILTVSRNKGDINDLISFLEEHQDDEFEYLIAGGAEIYSQAYKYCKKAYVSFIRGTYKADSYFDLFDINDWDIIYTEEYDEFIYKELRRCTIEK
ncbi:MAG: dihydrofolate reductase [Erysipelotrichaceae bacterium]